MSFEIKPRKKFSNQIRRRAKENYNAIVSGFRTLQINDTVAIYEMRTHLKKMRILLRLVRSKTGKKFYREENRRLRQIAGQFSSLRDLKVKLKLLHELELEIITPQTGRQIRELRIALERKHKLALSRLQSHRRKIKQAIVRAGDRIKKWPLKGLDKSDFKSGLERAFRRHARALQQARRNRKDTHLHKWRKRAKDIGHMLTVLGGILPHRHKQEVFVRLGRYLGEDHDVAILLDTMRRHQQKPLQPAEILSRRRAAFQKSAFDLVATIGGQ
jgi:hypothetical protein